MKLISLAFLVFIAGFCFSILAANDLSEVLEIQYLPNYNILTNLQFKMSQKMFVSSPRDLGTFPELIYEFPEKFGLREGKITFTRGLWESQKWSKAPFPKTSTGFQFEGRFSNIQERLRYLILY